MTAPVPACTVQPWPIDPTCLPKIPGLDLSGLYPGFVPGPDAYPGEGDGSAAPVDVAGWLPNADRPFALGDINPVADPIVVTRLHEAIRASIGVLSALLGHRYVVRCVTVRPCSPGRSSIAPYVGITTGGGWWVAYIDGAGNWQNYDPCTPAGACDPTGRGAVHLPRRLGPILRVVGVEVDGLPLDPTTWRLEGDVLYRSTGGAWPSQDITVPLGSPGTWAVTYLAGTPPPAGTAQHVATLAREFFALCGDDPDYECRLPSDWVTVSREGVTVSRENVAAMITARKTGLPEVDLWLTAHNPHGLREPVRVTGPADLLRRIV